MPFDLQSIKQGAQDRPPRIIVHGVEKIGKTTFASQFPDTVFLPIKGEEGIDAVDVSAFPTINTYAELMEALSTLATQEVPYKTVCIDSVSALEPLVWEYTCQVEGWANIESPGFGKGYAAALNHWTTLTDWLDHLRNNKNMTIILIGHVVVRTFNDPLTEPYDVYELDMNKKSAAKLKRWCDSILFCNRKAFVQSKEAGFNKKVAVATGGEHPCLYTQSRAAHEGGGRGVYGQLPYELPLEYQAFADAVSAAKIK